MNNHNKTFETSVDREMRKLSDLMTSKTESAKTNFETSTDLEKMKLDAIMGDKIDSPISLDESNKGRSGINSFPKLTALFDTNMETPKTKVKSPEDEDYWVGSVYEFYE